MANYIINQELNGIEISFDAKPEAATLERLKANGYRWHRAKKVWYAKNTATRLELAKAITDTTAPISAPALAKDKETINLDNLGVKPENFSFYGAELAKFIRDDLKRRGVKGATVRSRYSGYTTAITVTVKATAADFVSIEEGAERFNRSAFTIDLDRGIYIGGRYLYFDEWEKMTEEEQTATHRGYIAECIDRLTSVHFGYSWASRAHYWEFTSKFWYKLTAIYKIANQWNYCNDDIMTDYFDRGYYLDIDIKKSDDFAPRQDMTDDDRAAYESERAKEEAERAAALAKYEQEQKEAEERRKAYEEQEKKDTATILADITVEDIEPLYISDLSGGIGKECNLDELNENIGVHNSDAVITRKATFSNIDIFETFGKYLLNDWEFVAGKGGTASEDRRLENVGNLHALNTEQRAAVKWYMCDCVGVYVNKELMLVINPEGYSYPRYCYKPTEDTTITNAAGVLEDQAKASEELPPFYFPEPVGKQAVNLHAGQQITIYQCDGWILSSVYDNAGTIANIAPGDYAQYKGVYITFTSGKRSFIRDNHDCLIYEGIQSRLPEEVTSRRISANMCEMFNYDELFPRILEYYSKQGIHPIVDTIQR